MDIYIKFVANSRTSSFMQFDVYKAIHDGSAKNSISDNILIFPSEEPLIKAERKHLNIF